MKKVFVLIFSVGWLVPAWIGFRSFHSWVRLVVRPKLQPEFYDNIPITSFPHYEFAHQLWIIAGLWLTVVVISWAIYLVFYNQKKN